MMELVLSGVLFFGSLVALVFMIISKKQKKKEKSLEESHNVVDKSIKEILPNIYYDTENECFVDESENKVFDILRICSKDLINASEDEITYDQYQYTKLYKTYSEDLKLICINFPCNTQKQQKYLQKKLDGTNNAKVKAWLQKRIDELQWIEKYKTMREYYYMIFSNNVEDHLKNKMNVLSCLRTGRNRLCETISQDEKIQILFKLNNKSSLIS